MYVMLLFAVNGAATENFNLVTWTILLPMSRLILWNIAGSTPTVFLSLLSLQKKSFLARRSTAGIERCFNISKIIISDRRTRTADDSLEM